MVSGKYLVLGPLGRVGRTLNTTRKSHTPHVLCRIHSRTLSSKIRVELKTHSGSKPKLILSRVTDLLAARGYRRGLGQVWPRAYGMNSEMTLPSYGTYSLGSNGLYGLLSKLRSLFGSLA